MDVTHTYVVNTDFLEQARKVELEGRKLPQQHSNVTVTSLQRRRGLRARGTDSPGLEEVHGFSRSASNADVPSRTTPGLAAFPSMAVLKGTWFAGRGLRLLALFC